MTDIQAAVGREQLKRLPEIIAGRRFIAARYHELLADIPGVVLPQEAAHARTNWQSYCVRLPLDADQQSVMQSMLDRGIATRRGIMCSHREQVYASAAARGSLRHSEEARDRCVILPLYIQMAQADIRRVTDAFRQAVQQ